MTFDGHRVVPSSLSSHLGGSTCLKNASSGAPSRGQDVPSTILYGVRMCFYQTSQLPLFKHCSTVMVYTSLVPVWPLNVRGALMCRVSCVRSQEALDNASGITSQPLEACRIVSYSKACPPSCMQLQHQRRRTLRMTARAGHSCSTHSRMLHRATLPTYIANLTELFRLAQFVSRANGVASTLAMTTLGD
ncbi:hypothetical protein FKP32DRAFT_1595858 [Trametes sanguinea]|nr:hypothetical protein FKP32DRAFT_1595858 [Trametes sanguinea]